MSTFIQEFKTGYFYVAEKIKMEAGWRTHIIRRATGEEVKTYQAAKEGLKDLAYITCGNPACNRQVAMSRSQKHKFNTTYPLRYNQFTLVYCSQQCQDEHSKELDNKNYGDK